MSLKSVLICDDHAMMRESVEGVIEEVWPEAETRLAGDYPTAWAAMADAPSLCITDLMMPGAQPLEGVKRLTEASPATPILVFTGHEDDALLLALFRAGIAGFVPKTSNGDVVEAAIRVVLAGERYLPSRLLSVVAGSSHPPERSAARLTERQRDVMRLIASGLSNKEVARELDLSPATVKVHAAAAIAALGATNRTDAVLAARERGLI